MQKTFGALGGYLLGFGSLFVLWHVLSLYVIHSVLFPPPIQVFGKAIELARDGSLWENASISLQRIFLGFLFGSLIGIPLGLSIGSFRIVRRILEPYTEFLRFIPATALITVAVGDIDGFATWEPWPTRALLNVKGTKILQDAEGIYNNINFVYMNRTWIEKNEDAANRFMRSLVEANDLIGKDREAAAGMVSKFLKMPIELARELMPKVEYNMTLSDRAVETIKVAEDQLKKQGKLKAPLDYKRYVHSDLLKKVRPGNVTITKLPP